LPPARNLQPHECSWSQVGKESGGLSVIWNFLPASLWVRSEVASQLCARIQAQTVVEEVAWCGNTGQCAFLQCAKRYRLAFGHSRVIRNDCV
jgi:hypothetical protein